MWNFTNSVNDEDSASQVSEVISVSANVQHDVSQSNSNIHRSLISSHNGSEISTPEKMGINVTKDNDTEERQTGVVECNGDHVEKVTIKEEETSSTSLSIKNENSSDISEIAAVSDVEEICKQEINCSDGEEVTDKVEDGDSNLKTLDGDGVQPNSEVDLYQKVEGEFDVGLIAGGVLCGDPSKENENCPTENIEGSMDTEEGIDAQDIVQILTCDHHEDKVNESETMHLESAACNNGVNDNVDIGNETLITDQYCDNDHGDASVLEEITDVSQLQIPNQSSEITDMETNNALKVSEISRTECVPSGDNCNEIVNKDDGSSVNQQHDDVDERSTVDDGRTGEIVSEKNSCVDIQINESCDHGNHDNGEAQTNKAMSSGIDILPNEKRSHDQSCQDEPVLKRRRVVRYIIIC